MELLSPAGNVEKLEYAYAYGADAAYIGLKKFSLRVKADNFYEDEYKKVCELKKKYPGRRLHCALNISFHNRDIDNLLANLDYFKQYPIDAFIIQDLGIVPIMQKNFPNAELHVSTQASCMNREAVKMYKSLGFSRVVLGRECSLREIREIKDAVPDIEIETFVHGAMCIAYSGRCLMSAYLTGRSAQAGLCTHTCRWDYDVLADPAKAKAVAESGAMVLQEKSRPGEYFPVYEGDDFTAVLSSKDLNMIRHLDDLKKAGVDSLKIEGRMKSIYYVAMVTRAYRKALDALDGKITSGEAEPFIETLDEVPHRESTTGFYYSRTDADKTTSGESTSERKLAGTVGRAFATDEAARIFDLAEKTYSDRQAELAGMHPAAREAALKDEEAHPEKRFVPAKFKEGWKLYLLNPMNKVDSGEELEAISPDVLCEKLSGGDYDFVNPRTGALRDWINPDHDCAIYTKADLIEGTLIRIKNE